MIKETIMTTHMSLSSETILPYQAEFFIKLREIEKVLPSTVQDEIKQDLQKLWDTEALEIVNITNALDRGGRVPLPLAGHFEGYKREFLPSDCFFTPDLILVKIKIRFVSVCM